MRWFIENTFWKMIHFLKNIIAETNRENKKGF